MTKVGLAKVGFDPQGGLRGVFPKSPGGLPGVSRGGGGAKGWGPKISRFFLPSPTKFRSFFSLGGPFEPINENVEATRRERAFRAIPESCQVFERSDQF